MKQPGDRPMGSLIREAREAKRLSRREVGEALSLNDQYLYQVETGRRRPTLETLWELATFLGINPHDLDQRLAPRDPQGQPFGTGPTEVNLPDLTRSLDPKDGQREGRQGDRMAQAPIS